MSTIILKSLIYTVHDVIDHFLGNYMQIHVHCTRTCTCTFCLLAGLSTDDGGQLEHNAP